MVRISRNVRVAVALVSAACVGGAANAAVISVTGAGSEGYHVNEGGGTPVVANAGQTGAYRVGSASGAGNGRNPVYYFAIPTLSTVTADAAADPIVSVNARFNIASYTAPSTGPINGDLYVIGTPVSGPSGRIVRYNESNAPENVNSVRIEDDFLTPALIGPSTNVTVNTDDDADAALATYLRAFYAANTSYDASVQAEVPRPASESRRRHGRADEQQRLPRDVGEQRHLDEPGAGGAAAGHHDHDALVGARADVARRPRPARRRDAPPPSPAMNGHARIGILGAG